MRTSQTKTKGRGGPSFTMKVLPLVSQGAPPLLTRGGSGDGEWQIKNNARSMNGTQRAYVRSALRTNERMAQSLSLALWYGFVLLNWIAYKCDRWRMSPNYRATPDSLSRASPVSLSLSLSLSPPPPHFSLSSFLSETEVRMRKTGKLRE